MRRVPKRLLAALEAIASRSELPESMRTNADVDPTLPPFDPTEMKACLSILENLTRSGEQHTVPPPEACPLLP